MASYVHQMDRQTWRLHVCLQLVQFIGVLRNYYFCLYVPFLPFILLTQYEYYRKRQTSQEYCIEKADLNIMSNQTRMYYILLFRAFCLVAVQICILHLVLSNNNLLSELRLMAYCIAYKPSLLIRYLVLSQKVSFSNIILKVSFSHSKWKYLIQETSCILS